MEVELDFDAVPLLDGAAEVAAAGVTSSLHGENLRAVKHMVRNPEALQMRCAPCPPLSPPPPPGPASFITCASGAAARAF